MKTKITPEMATAMLAKNPNNRRVSKALVNKYQRDMAEGRWKYNGQPIIISTSGNLLDGQHRLEACVKCGKPFETVLLRDMPDDIIDTVDAGRKRSVGDVIHINGMAEGYAPAVAASSRLILNYIRGESLQSSQSAASTMELLECCPDVIEATILAHTASKIVQTSALGAVMFLGTRLPTFDKRSMAFVKGLASGADLKTDDPRLTLRNAFINARARSPGGRAPLTMWAFMSVVTAWNAFVRQGPLSRIKMQPGPGGRIIPADILGGPKRGEGLLGFGERKESKPKASERKANAKGQNP